MSNGSLGADVSDADVRGMVGVLEPSWEVVSVERADEGTDFVAMLEAATPAGERRVVLKATTAVLDWANLTSADPANNLVAAGANLLDPVRDPEERTASLRDAFRGAYGDARDDWAFDDSVRERVRVYALASRLDAMACLPLWYEDSDGRDRREADHRAFVTDYL